MAVGSANEIKRVVVRSTNWVGDSVMTLPALRALRRVLPETKITLVVRPSAKGIFADVDFVDEVLVYDRPNAFSVFSQIKEWRRRQFDLAVLFQNAFEAALIPFLAGVPLRLGYATEARRALLTHPLPLPEWRSSRHEVFYYLYLVTALEQMLFGTSAICEGDPDASLTISDARKTEAENLLRAYGVREGEPVVALVPGSINSRAKRWSAESYAALADRLIESKRQVVLIGSANEVDVSTEVTTRMQQRPIVLTGKTSLDHVFAFARRPHRDQRHRTSTHRCRTRASDTRDIWTNKSTHDAAVCSGSRNPAASARLCAVYAARLSNRPPLHDGDHCRGSLRTFSCVAQTRQLCENREESLRFSRLTRT
jgi:heptosyltransferase-2